jgi:CxxC motif-containing protein (DUF1111 family)
VFKKIFHTMLLTLGFIISVLGASIALNVQPVTAAENDQSPIPVQGLTAEELSRFQNGQELFEHRFLLQEGRGPFFNQTSCHNCHRKPTVGGFGPEYRSNIQVGTRGNPGETNLFHERSNRNGPSEDIPAGSLLSKRRPPFLFGLGLVEAIPEEAIRANEDSDDQDGDGISGRAAFNKDDQVMRFGSQAHQPSIFIFVADALLQEIGLTSPVSGFKDELHPPTPGISKRITIPQPNVTLDTVNALTDFVTFLAPPPVATENLNAEWVQRGQVIFHNLRCSTCHTPSFVTSSEPVVDENLGTNITSPALLNQEIFPYSDFLLHDFGPNFNDGVALGVAGPSEYRTPPLWGLRFHKNQLLHDSRAANIEQAILFHSGEAAQSRSQYLALPASDKRALREFLESL